MNVKTKHYLEETFDKDKHGHLIYDTIVDEIVFWLDSIEKAKGLKVKDAIIIHLERSIKENYKLLNNIKLTMMMQDNLLCFLNECRTIINNLMLWIPKYEPLHNIVPIFYHFESKCICIMECN